jgi:DNA-directed RNA polymerase specialized sigma24 family protein
VGKPPFETLVREHGGTVLRVCRAVLGPVDAQDAWSETFLAALRAYPELPAAANHQAWLVTIAHRKALDATRATRRSPVPVGGPVELPAARSAPFDPASTPRVLGPAVLDPDADLWAALAELPLRQRQALAYHHLVGLPYREIAALLATTEAAARRSAADAARTLRRVLADRARPDPNPPPGGAR